jgi:hypothetical protein
MPPTHRGHNWGQLTIADHKVVLKSADPADNDAAIAAVPLSDITYVTRKAGEVAITVKTPAPSAATKHAVYLTDLRFAVPKSVAGLEEDIANGEDASRLLHTMVQNAHNAHHGVAAGAAAASSGAGAAGAVPTLGGTLIGEFANVQLSQPAGIYDLRVTTDGVTFTDRKKLAAGASGAAFAVRAADIGRMFMLPVPNADASYGVLTLKPEVVEGVRVGAQALRAIVMLFANDATAASAVAAAPKKEEVDVKGDADAAADVKTEWVAAVDQARLGALFPEGKCFMQARMSGSMADAVLGVLKTVAQCPLSGANDDFKTRGTRTCALSATYKSTNGYLYVLKVGLVFLHRPATFIPYTAIEHVSVEKTTQLLLTVESRPHSTAKLEKGVFSGIALAEQGGLLEYLQGREVRVAITEAGRRPQDEDDEGEGEEEEGEEDDESFDDDASDEDESDEDSDDSEASGRKKKKEKKSKKDKKSKKEKSEKKSKKDKSDKKEKKDKSDKKEKSDKKDKSDKKEKSEKREKKDRRRERDED